MPDPPVLHLIVTKPLSKQIIQSVDHSEVIDEKTISSPVFGNMSPKKLSGGVKTLMLMNFDSEHIFNASACGDNCASWILKIAQKKDLTIRLGYLMDFGSDNFDIEIVNLHQTVHTMKELNEAVLDNHLL